MTIVPGSAPADFGGEALHLLPDRAVWWPARQTLVVADVHLGKGAAFRSAGLPVPAGGTARDLDRLDALLGATGAARLVVLGDLVHARSSHRRELTDAFARWRDRHAARRVLLVRGNHDRRAGRLPPEWGVEEVEEPAEDAGLTFSHVPRVLPGTPVLAGHVHPVFAMRDFDRTTATAPCFVLDGEACLALPAFGTFTGGHRARPADGRRIFVTSGRSVVRVV